MAFTLNDFNAFPTGMQIRRYTGNSEMAFTLPRPKRGFADMGNSENNASYNIRRLKCGAS